MRYPFIYFLAGYLLSQIPHGLSMQDQQKRRLEMENHELRILRCGACSG